VIPKGNTFSVVFQYKEDGTPTQMPEGYDMVVGLYNYNGDVVIDARVSNGRLSFEQDRYILKVTHEESLSIEGSATIELTIINSNLEIVEHASDVIDMVFKDRKNNMIL
jgi:hypothetical protein